MDGIVNERDAGKKKKHKEKCKCAPPFLRHAFE